MAANGTRLPAPEVRTEVVKNLQDSAAIDFVLLPGWLATLLRPLFKVQISVGSMQRISLPYIRLSRNSAWCWHTVFTGSDAAVRSRAVATRACAIGCGSAGAVARSCAPEHALRAKPNVVRAPAIEHQSSTAPWARSARKARPRARMRHELCKATTKPARGRDAERERRRWSALSGAHRRNCLSPTAVVKKTLPVKNIAPRLSASHFSRRIGQSVAIAPWNAAVSEGSCSRSR